ncbi:2-hydroxy-3-keto-5-methylthiopentenyl-1-phosphate phosphatase [Rossellomorea vietnamensis]|uniref:2-hydroxy-3-keto-5-methylthiopentenyl-1-phosphate phosphatase n=1 Tax=Rossellomorea vietnamensis TaxID=218284 RepID=A0A5D4MD92_9BACI|nr:2-hydroxy-3-keto-5-methylthiopentenyl-1-phosphate phosphatase [Rossellomorea vietnamensis]TYR99303.1 2-hydroxy-3-keto-5-methylthiopentenyl-1-phosphate phosphatase [Rossellomorea vietnamensis]
MKKLKIYCDFDGTITTTDNIISLMKKFAPPEWTSIKDDILAQKKSIKQGVGEMFLLLPSSSRTELIDYLLDTYQLRLGFLEFIEWSNQKNIDLKIVSGGIDFFVEPILKGIVPFEKIYCNSSDFSGDKIRITWPYSCDVHCSNECGCCKTSIIRTDSEKGDYIIVIGDSITDLEGAKLADLVLACDDFLADKCGELGLNYRFFNTFNEVISIVNEINREAEADGELPCKVE